MKPIQPSRHPIPDSSSGTYPKDYFPRLYGRHLGKVFWTSLAITEDERTAQDYPQNIFLKAFEKPYRFQNRSSFSTWPYEIIHSRCLTELRQGGGQQMEPLTEPCSRLREQSEPAGAVAR